MLGFALIPVSSGHSRDSMIAFSSDRDSPGDQDIFVMMADGSQPRNLTNNPTSYDSVPDWSPDGNKIAFISDRKEKWNSEIYVMDADGGNPIRLTREPETARRLVGLPMGRKLPFIRSAMGTLKFMSWTLMVAIPSGLPENLDGTSFLAGLRMGRKLPFVLIAMGT